MPITGLLSCIALDALAQMRRKPTPEKAGESVGSAIAAILKQRTGTIRCQGSEGVAGQSPSKKVVAVSGREPSALALLGKAAPPTGAGLPARQA